MRAQFAVFCSGCGAVVIKGASAFNRSPTKVFYCDQKCAGLGRRVAKPNAEKAAEKAAYDARYRAENAERLRASKAAYNAATYDPDEARRHRAANAEAIREYRATHMRTPSYRAAKREYDKALRASEYGEFAICHQLLIELERELRSRGTKYQRARARGYYDKPSAQTRKRVCQNHPIH